MDVENEYKDTFRVYFGGDVCVLTKNGDITVLRVKNQNLVRMRRTQEGVSLSATVYREDGRLVAQIEDNKYMVNPNTYFMPPLRIDKSTLSVRDKYGTEVLRASFLNEQTFEILGVFEVPGVPTLRVTRDGITVGNRPPLLSHNIAANPGKTCFEFSSTDDNS